MFEKKSALNADVKLYPHQQRVVDNPSNTMVIAHGVGGGKTLTSIAKFEKMKENGQASKALVVTPASLRDNFEESGIKRFTDSTGNIVGNKQEIAKGTYHDVDPNADYNIVSYEMFRKNPKKLIQQTQADTIIYDEAHRGKNENTITTEAIKSSRPLVKNYTGLTGSVVSNSISDLQPLVDAATGGKHDLGLTKKDFEQKFLIRDNSKKYREYSEKRRPVIGIANKGKLRKELSGIVDYLDYNDLKELADMPDKNIKVRKIPISREQAKLYKKILSDDPKALDLIKRKRLETLKDDEAAKAFSKLVESRKLMNSIGSVKPGISLSESAQITPKTNTMLNDLEKYLKKNPEGQAVLMSHLINGGVDVMEQGLKDRDIPYGRFIGKGNEGVTEELRQQDVNDYNAGKKKVMLISPAGGEGLSLNDTSWEGVLDPHYNPEKMNQMEARGIRSGGLKDKDDRTVYVNRYISTMPKTLGIFKSSIRTPDEFIYEIAQNKQRSNDVLFSFLKDMKKKENKAMKKSASEELDELVLYKQAAEENNDFISDETIEELYRLVQECFQMNRFWDRAVSVMSVDFAMPVASNAIHLNIAHAYPLLADRISEILDKVNIKTDYNETVADNSNYSNLTEVFEKAYELTKQLYNHLKEVLASAQAKHESHVVVALIDFQKLFSEFVAQSILLKDKAKQYSSYAEFDKDFGTFFTPISLTKTASVQYLLRLGLEKKA